MYIRAIVIDLNYERNFLLLCLIFKHRKSCIVNNVIRTQLRCFNTTAVNTTYIMHYIINSENYALYFHAWKKIIQFFTN